MKSIEPSLWKVSFVIGMVSGLGLVAFLWVVQLISENKVFTLLLNVDFFPVLGEIVWPIWMEIIFHLIISWAIAFIFCLFIKRKPQSENKKWIFALALSVAAGFSYFPLSLLALKPVPATDDLMAVFLWFLGHILYGILLKKVTELLASPGK